jgi:hypothetical protein
MASVIIGGRAIEVALPNFKTLKAAWRHIAAVQGEVDPMVGIEAILGVVAVGAVGETMSVAQLEEQLTPAEMAGLRPFINALMVEAGLASPPGEAAPSTEAASPSTAISTPSSPNWSPPDAPAATGTA